MIIRIRVVRKHFRPKLDEYILDVNAENFADAVWKAKENLLADYNFYSMGEMISRQRANRCPDCSGPLHKRMKQGHSGEHH